MHECTLVYIYVYQYFMQGACFLFQNFNIIQIICFYDLSTSLYNVILILFCSIVSFWTWTWNKSEHHVRLFVKTNLYVIDNEYLNEGASWEDIRHHHLGGKRPQSPEHPPQLSHGCRPCIRREYTCVYLFKKYIGARPLVRSLVILLMSTWMNITQI